jgi:hypothetical protein
MPGGRAIMGSDLHAALRLARGDPAPLEALRAAVAEDDVVASYEELVRMCPPERTGLSPGAHASIFAPLFGEFE